MADVVIVDYVRTPFGKRNGVLSGVHPADLLGVVFTRLLERSGVPSELVDLVMGGCVTQVGEQSSNITRLAWLHAGLAHRTGVSTIDNQCGSAQQAAGLLASHISAGVVRCGIACGVESMSRLPLGSGLDHGSPMPPSWSVDLPHQLVAADRIARHRGLSRSDLDGYAVLSQERAGAAWAAGFFDDHVVPVALGVPWQATAKDGSRSGPVVEEAVSDQGIRSTSLERLGALKPVLEDGLHTAGNSSQISDGACALLMMDAELAQSLGLRPRAKIVAQALVGADPHLHLDGPVDVTEVLLEQVGGSVADFDVVEVNEAFASVPLSWARHFEAPVEQLNPHGGAIAVGHPVGITGVRLLGQAMTALERTDGERALVAMCCGGAQATGTVLQRL